MANVLMATTIIVLTAITLITMYVKIGSVETFNNTIDKKCNEALEAEKRNNERLNNVIQTYNRNFELYKDMFADIDAKMEAIISDIKRMDEVELKATEARRMASDVARCYMIGADNNNGVNWAADMKCSEDEETNNG